MGRPVTPMEDRFWAKVKKTKSGCWLFISAKGGGAYGMLSVPKGEEFLAHRISWTLHNGPVPEDMFVLHMCDVPKCVNPDHLFLGTHQDNSDDKLSKGRHCFGETSPISPFDNETILRIRKEYSGGGISQLKLANRYGVHQTAISAIVRRATWKHV